MSNKLASENRERESRAENKGVACGSISVLGKNPRKIEPNGVCIGFTEGYFRIVKHALATVLVHHGLFPWDLGELLTALYIDAAYFDQRSIGKKVAWKLQELRLPPETRELILGPRKNLAIKSS